MAYTLGYHYYVMIVAVFLSAGIASLLKMYSSIKFSSGSAAVIIALGLYYPNFSPFTNTELRLTESMLGVAVALIFISISVAIKIRE